MALGASAAAAMRVCRARRRFLGGLIAIPAISAMTPAAVRATGIPRDPIAALALDGAPAWRRKP
ncbi:MAG: hypothetical protein IIZ38_20880 [Sphingomonas sp.]|uniref:hypothetical protein n=1 Tax=unclassified Sphingomonas TaxID=196159 RepID=UPI00245743B4|nr:MULTISPECIES: hypothetical protein [unclassified Sphingomonas]MBQ1500772.1 hypothetical protein [Sphingomonas sp.]MDH4744666.1 hypothetical protein [Sphingomonas sp. CBMAI 2297]